MAKKIKTSDCGKSKSSNENKRLREEMSRIEANVAKTEDQLTRARRELNAAYAKEERLRARLKTLEAEGGGGGGRGKGKGKGRSNNRQPTNDSEGKSPE
ncbi:unnamed protein product, partial [Discosporangium mesarthrocarpum]